MHATADISECGRYRYLLTRTWSSAPPICFVMLNPSTADALVDDPTIRRCTGFALRWGYGGLVVANLFALRSPSPTALLEPGLDPVGPRDDDAIRCATASAAGQVVCAWGSPSSTALRGLVAARVSAVVPLLADCRLLCLGTALSGHPRHPLYLPNAEAPRPWRPCA